MPKNDDKELILPFDSNEDAKKYAKKFKDPVLMVMMSKYMDKTLFDGYGEAIHLDENGSPEIIFAFTNGICKHASIVAWFNNRNVAKGSKKFH